MLPRTPTFLLCLIAALGLTGLAALDFRAEAQGASAYATPREARASLDRAQKAAREAEERADTFSRQAREAGEAAEKATREAAALAAQIQLAEANSTEAEARLALITDQRRVLDRQLARRQGPIVRLTAALQNMSRRPLALSALKPGSLRDTVYVRAVLGSAIPEVRSRTASLRAELAKGKALEREAAIALQSLRESENRLTTRRSELSALAARQRTTSRNATGSAKRENDRALALAEEARDLDALVGQLDTASRLRRELAALPGPIMRPPRPGESEVVEPAGPRPAPSSTAAPSDLRLPVQGRTITGYGEMGDAGLRATGISIAPRPGAQVVSPGRGRIAFAGRYRGYGQIVIVEHPNGWTSLVTGLGRTDVQAGDDVVGGSPLGVAPSANPAITLELRREGSARNPLQYMD